MDNFAVSHFFDFITYPEKRWNVLFEEFAQCGATSLAIDSGTGEQMMGRPSVLKTFRQLGEKNGLKFMDAHGLWGGEFWDLNVAEEDRRRFMLDQHKLCIRLMASLGVKTYTMHIGALCCVQNTWLGHEEDRKSVV